MSGTVVLSLVLTAKAPEPSLEVLSQIRLGPRTHVYLPSAPMFNRVTQKSSGSCSTDIPLYIISVKQLLLLILLKPPVGSL